LTVGEFPAELNFVKIEGRKYRRALEDAVLKTHQEVSLSHAHLIDTAAGATVHAGICRWLLRERIGTMSTADVLACSREMLRAKETRDRSVRMLDLDRDRIEDEIDALYDDPDEPEDKPEKALGLPSNATKGKRREKIPKGTKRPVESKLDQVRSSGLETDDDEWDTQEFKQ